MLHSTLKKTLLILSLLLIRTEAVADNSVNITQVGDTNIINMDIEGDDNTVVAKQACSANTCNGDTMVMDVTGDRNTMNLGQGYKISESGNWTYDNQEYGGHDMDLYVSGSDNGIKLSQRSNNNISDHSMDINIYSDNNSVHIMQEQNVDKTLTLTINNDDNDVSIHQRKSHGHTATVTLSGSYGTDLDLQQGTNNTTQGLSYSLSQNCQTVGGCSVSVSQE